MERHMPAFPSKEIRFWTCPCSQGKPHSRFIAPGGVSRLLYKKTLALQFLSLMTTSGQVDEVQASRIRQEIENSALEDPQPNCFQVCSDPECDFAKIKHGHFIVNGQSREIRCGINGATALLPELKSTLDLSDEDVARMQGQIDASGLPASTPADSIFEIFEHHWKKQRSEFQNSGVTATIHLSGPTRSPEKMMIDGQEVRLSPGGKA